MLLLFPDISAMSDADSIIYTIHYSLFGDTVAEYHPDYTLDLLPVGFAGFLLSYLLYLQSLKYRWGWAYQLVAIVAIPASCWFAAPVVLYFWGNVFLSALIITISLLYKRHKKILAKLALERELLLEQEAAAAAAAAEAIENAVESGWTDKDGEM